MVYLLIAFAVLLFAAFGGLWFYIDYVDRKNDLAESEALRTLALTELSDALAQAKLDRSDAYRSYVQKHRLWQSYKWGRRHNPHFVPYMIARGVYARTCRRVDKLEAIIREKEGPLA